MSYDKPECYIIDTQDGMRVVITNNIQNVPLHSWWVFEIMVDDVEGTLLDPLQNGMSGPFRLASDAFGAIGMSAAYPGLLIDDLGKK